MTASRCLSLLLTYCDILWAQISFCLWIVPACVRGVAVVTFLLCVIRRWVRNQRTLLQMLPLIILTAVKLAMRRVWMRTLLKVLSRLPPVQHHHCHLPAPPLSAPPLMWPSSVRSMLGGKAAWLAFRRHFAEADGSERPDLRQDAIVDLVMLLLQCPVMPRALVTASVSSTEEEVWGRMRTQMSLLNAVVAQIADIRHFTVDTAVIGVCRVAPIDSFSAVLVGLNALASSRVTLPLESPAVVTELIGRPVGGHICGTKISPSRSVQACLRSGKHVLFCAEDDCYLACSCLQSHCATSAPETAAMQRNRYFATGEILTYEEALIKWGDQYTAQQIAGWFSDAWPTDMTRVQQPQVMQQPQMVQQPQEDDESGDSGVADNDGGRNRKK